MLRILSFSFSLVTAISVAASEIPANIHDVNAGNTTDTFSFPANNNMLQPVIGAINRAEHSIDMTAYHLTSRALSDALIAAKNRGVRVRIVTSRFISTQKEKIINQLKSNDIAVRIDPYFNSMHDKFMVIDNITVQTDSFMSRYATSDTTHDILINNAPTLAATYQSEFRRLWNEAITINVQQ